VAVLLFQVHQITIQHEQIEFFPDHLSKTRRCNEIVCQQYRKIIMCIQINLKHN